MYNEQDVKEIREITQLEFDRINNDEDLDTLDAFWCVQELEDSIHDFSNEDLKDLIMIEGFYYSMEELSNHSELMGKINKG